MTHVSVDKACVQAGDARVIARTRAIGGGGADAARLAVARLKAGAACVWFCSFPGHSSLMKGALTLAR